MSPVATCPQAEPLIEVGLADRLLYPEHEAYLSRIDSYWCNNAKLKPACILQPRNTAEVAVGVRSLGNSKQPFAIRSGGHGNWPGINNIAGGVTIDLSLMSAVEYDRNSRLARIGPGAVWKNVYAELEKYERVVAGGREAQVGVGGFLLGGGNTFYTGRHGFGCDNILAYEVVLADGSIVLADIDGKHKDLFRVLKGGGNNFGLVTCFTMQTFPSGPLWGGYSVKPMETMSAVAEALANFTEKSSDDPDSNLNLTVGHMPKAGGSAIVAICTNIAGMENPPIYEELSKLPDIYNNLKVATMQEIISYPSMPTHYFNVWQTLCFKNDASIISHMTMVLVKLTNELKERVSDGDFETHCSLQPLTKASMRHSIASGGNILGLEKYEHNAILLQANISVRTQELADWARPRLKSLIDSVSSFAKSIENGLCPWLYLNYAGKDQKVLESYGKDIVLEMKEASAKYDPDAVFQELCPGGFKVSAVDLETLEG